MLMGACGTQTLPGLGRRADEKHGACPEQRAVLGCLAWLTMLLGKARRGERLAPNHIQHRALHLADAQEMIAELVLHIPQVKGYKTFNRQVPSMHNLLR